MIPINAWLTCEEQYIDLIETLKCRPVRSTRNAETRSAFACQVCLRELAMKRFPIIQARKIFWKGVVGELAAFLKGPKELYDFTSQGCNFWSPWADEEGLLNVDYGNAWIDYNGVNQLKDVVESLIKDPNGRRHLISGWRPERLKQLSLPCCHYAYQWYVDRGYLEMIWIQRSVDVMIGLPSDMVSAALFNILMAQTVGLRPGLITMQLGDVHIYEHHMPQVEEYLKSWRENIFLDTPYWELNPEATVFNFSPDMFKITDYQNSPVISMEVIP